MKRCFSLFAILGALVANPVIASDKVNVFACEPEWASLAQEIGKEKVSTFSATSARQDPHHIRATPGLIAAMRKSDLVICSGASLEVGWLPILLEKAGNANTQPGAKGHLQATDFVPVLEKPIRLDRANGDVHPEGNPHVQLDPRNITLVAVELNKRLQRLDPANALIYQANYVSFAKRWQEAISQWEKEASDLKDMPVVVHHQSFSYLLNWLGMNAVGSLEPKPGLPPTTAHLEALLQALKTKPASIILRTPYEPAEASEWLEKKTGTNAICLPFTINGNEKSTDLFRLFESTIALLKETNNDK